METKIKTGMEVGRREEEEEEEEKRLPRIMLFYYMLFEQSVYLRASMLMMLGSCGWWKLVSEVAVLRCDSHA
jgi:hypothetical protein